MSEPIDFAGIIAWAMTDPEWNDKPLHSVQVRDAALVRAAKVPALCPDCHGVGSWPVKPGGVACGHEHAPTIGSMLAEWQALTALAGWAQHYPACGRRTSPYHPHVTCTCGLDAARAALEEARNPK